MRQVCVVVTIMFGLLISSRAALAQSAQADASAVPRVMNVTGVFRPADGQPPAAVETVTLSIYADPEGGTPVWQETQQVTLDERGRYTVLLGATRADGIPAAVMATGAQWLSTHFERTSEVEGARVRLTSVPYALRAADADTLGGRPAADYLLATNPTGDGKSATTATRSDIAAPAGTANFLPKYVDAVNLGDSALYETGGMIGLGTTTPFDLFHVRFTNTGGTATGLAVQNLGNTATSYSGMLFYDQNGALGQFQGFNNVTHEYRINNVARNGANVSDGSINFMTGNTSRFVVASTGNIGIGTTAPSALLEVSNAVSGGGSTSTTLTTYLNAFGGSSIVGQRARGTAAAPTALQNGDSLLELNTRGYGATGFGTPGKALIVMGTSENWTDTAQGTQISFFTTANGSTTPGTRMRIAASGNVGIGTFSPVSNLEVSNALSTTAFGQVTTSTFANSGAASLFVGSKARGTSAAPLAVQGGDLLAGFLARGFFAGATTGFSGTRGGMFVTASENWTDTAQGTSLNFNTTATGTNTPGTRVTISPSGNVGIGTTNPGVPLQIVRNGETTIVGTSFNDDDGSAVFFQRARGTSQTPSASQAGDALGYFGAGGYGATTFGDGVGAMAVVAAENWTDTANGTTVAFATTPLGTTDFVPQAAILPNGFLGLGTPGDANGIPTATDRLQVFGDIRVGNAGTNGCVKRFDGTALMGTCSSDRRFKKDITPFAPVLGQLTALQPVHYYWRADEFPNRHFGNSRSYGLIAQDVEPVLPELVATDGDGYKAVDYSQLPLLTLQAVKELKAENDARKAENDALKQRIAELERLMTEMHAATSRR
jgi:hypothetical protein